MKTVRKSNENERLKALHSLGIMHSERVPEFDAVVETIASIFECPIALISFVDKDEQWFKARCGLDADGTSRDVSFCQYALSSDNLLVVNDALDDERFRDNSLVTGEPHIRFYAGCPLSLDGQNFLGTLCVIDTKPKSPTTSQLEQLKRLGRVVEGLIKAHRAVKDKEKAFAKARAEHQLAVREGELLEEVANVSGVGGWELCLKTNELTWTSKTREIHEVDDDFKPIVERALEFYPPDSREQISRAIEVAIENMTGWDVELPFITAKKREIWVRAAGRPVIENDEVTRLIGSFQDITERKKSEDQIRYSEVVQRTTLQSLDEGVLLLSHSGEIQSINPAGARFLGYDPEELVGKRVRDLDIELKFDGVGKRKSNALLQLAATHPDKVEDVVAYVTRNGSDLGSWLRVNAALVDEDNEYGVDGVVVSLKDVTDSRRQEETLRAVFDNFPGGIVYRDKDSRLVACNDVFQKMFDYPDWLIEKKADRLEFMRFLAERGDYGPGEPDQLVHDRYKTWDLSAPTQEERTTADGRVLDARSTPLPDGGVVFSFFDITERKHAEQRISHSEAVQRTTLEALREGILLLTPEGEIQSANPAASRLLGYTAEDLTGLNVKQLKVDMICNLDGGITKNDPLALAASDPLMMQDVVAQLSTGPEHPTIWLRINARPIDPDQQIGFEGIVVSLTDITETKQQADTLKAVFDNLPGAVIYHDKNMRFAGCNDAFKKIFKIPDEMVAKKLHAREYALHSAKQGIYGPGDPEEIASSRLNYVKGAEAKATQGELELGDGTILETRRTPLPDGSTVVSFFDITERKLSERKIRNSAVVQRTTLEALSEGILLLTPAGEIQSVNPAAANLLGYAIEDLVGLNVGELEVDLTCELAGGSHVTNPLTLAAQDPLIMHDVPAELSTGDAGSTIWLRVNARPIEQDDEIDFEGIVVSLTDITETKQQADTLQVIFDNFPGAVAHFDAHFQLAGCNQDYGTLLGYPDEFITQKLHILDYLKFSAERGDYGEGEPEQLALERFDLLQGEDFISFDRSTADGKYLEIRGTSLPTGGSIYNFFDVTERKKMERELAESEQLARNRLEELEAILANMRQGVSVFDEHGKLTLWNQQYVDIFGKPQDEVTKGKSLIELISAEKERGEFEGDVQEHVMDLMIRLSSGEVVRSKFTHSNGKIISVIQAPLPGGGWIGTHEDITLREQAAAKITHAAHHDELTGLANRTLFNATLNETLVGAQIQGTHGHLLLMDLDQFKPVNDTYGHDVGDELLKQASQRVKDCVRSSDLVARLGGDEFAIVLRGTGPNPDRAAEIAERIVHSLEIPFSVFAHKIKIGVSLGVARINENSDGSAAIIKEADIALYDVKKNGRNGFQFFDDAPVIRAVRN
ncbi:MAG: PAS-domain containing protein [Roseibium sp.]